jgi:hypothetical protein
MLHVYRDAATEKNSYVTAGKVSGCLRRPVRTFPYQLVLARLFLYPLRDDVNVHECMWPLLTVIWHLDVHESEAFEGRLRTINQRHFSAPA